MIVQGLVMDADDVVVTRQMNTRTQQAEDKCSFKLMTSKPTQVIEVKLSPEQTRAGGADVIRAAAGQMISWDLEFRNSSFGDDKNQHRQFAGFQLFRLPELKGK